MRGITQVGLALVLLVYALSCVGFELKQVEFQANWQHKTAELPKNEHSHVVAAGLVVVMDFQLRVDKPTRIASILLSTLDEHHYADSWPHQVRLGAWGYQHGGYIGILAQYNANRLYPLEHYGDVLVDADKSLRINVLVWVDNRLQAVLSQGELIVVDEDGNVANAHFSINKLPIALDLLDAPVGVFEHRYDYSKERQFEKIKASDTKNLQRCVNVFADALGLKHVVGYGNKPSYQRARLVDIEQYERRYRRYFERFFGNYPYQQSDMYHWDDFNRMYRTLAVGQFTYINQQLQLFYEQGLWLPDLMLNEHLPMLTSLQEIKFAQLRAVLGSDSLELNKNSLEPSKNSLEPSKNSLELNENSLELNKNSLELNKNSLEPDENQQHPLYNSVVFNQVYHSVEQYFAGMITEQQKISAGVIEQLHHQAKLPWFFNLSDKRSGAGWYLWRSGANGYMQFLPNLHASLPWEIGALQGYDFAFYYPTNNAYKTQCQRNIGADLVIDSQWLALAEGVLDRRWILWLQHQALLNNSQGENARQLLAQFKQQVPSDWSEFTALLAQRPYQLAQWRRQILQFAAKF